jgi:ribonucleotide reductase alpha subunit
MSSTAVDADEEMYVTKRNGNREIVSFDKISRRIKTLGAEANIKINYTSLVMKVIDQIYNNISTTKIDELSAEQCASMSTVHPDYNILAGRIVISNLHKNTTPSFSDAMTRLYDNKDKHDKHSPIVSQTLMDVVNKYKNEIDSTINHDSDYLIDYFGFKTLERAYLMRHNKVVVERPQYMWMRVSIGIHGDDIDKVKETYHLMSNKYFTHATPTLFNAGTPHPQLSSCYLLAMEKDSIEGIYNTLKDCALISKWAGGIGLHIHNVRASGSDIRGTNGTSNGIVPMLRVFNHTAKYVDQGGGKRNGSFAMYLEPWHADIEIFLEMRKNHGEEDLKARDLFYALWTPDLFMERVKTNADWTLMCPDECPGLADVYGEDFTVLYEKYESDGKGRKTMKARDLWFQVLDAQMETGTPYLLYKDSVNKKSNQANLGTIKSSNLCCEITEYSDDTETAVCNLASIALPAFVKNEPRYADDGETIFRRAYFDFKKLHEVTKVVTNNLNKIIDVNFYPTEKTRKSNMRHRPIGLGVQGLADVFFMMDISFSSEEANKLNKDIFETMYHASLEMSNEITIERYKSLKHINNEDTSMDMIADKIMNEYEKPLLPMLSENNKTVGSYSSFIGSPMSKGIFQFDMWGVEPSNRYDWVVLKNSIMTYGIRNSLLMAPMPTASTSQILGYNECIEPITSNIYSRRTIAGEFVLANKYLMNDLINLKSWNEDIKNSIVKNQGSIQHLVGIPDIIKDKYKTVWELPMKQLINMAADRGAFICQSQSLNLWLEDPNYKNLTSMHFYSWEKGLKTGIYYLRRRARHQAQQFTIEPEKAKTTNVEEDEICEMCSA